jgi:hypothetical protein
VKRFLSSKEASLLGCLTVLGTLAFALACWALALYAMKRISDSLLN